MREREREKGRAVRGRAAAGVPGWESSSRSTRLGPRRLQTAHTGGNSARQSWQISTNPTRKPTSPQPKHGLTPQANVLSGLRLLKVETSVETWGKAPMVRAQRALPSSARVAVHYQTFPASKHTHLLIALRCSPSKPSNRLWTLFYSRKM